jgi:hypothetical protein
MDFDTQIARVKDLIAKREEPNLRASSVSRRKSGGGTHRPNMSAEGSVLTAAGRARGPSPVKLSK